MVEISGPVAIERGAWGLVGVSDWMMSRGIDVLVTRPLNDVDGSFTEPETGESDPDLAKDEVTHPTTDPECEN